MVVPAVAVPEPGRAAPLVAPLLGPVGTKGFRLKAKPAVAAAEVVVVVVVVLVVEVPGAAPGALRLKPRVPAPGVAAVVAGAERDSTVALDDEAGAGAMEAKSVAPALVVAAVGAAAAGCAAPAVVVTSAAGVKGEPDSAGVWAELPTEPMLKPDAPGWGALPLVNENPVEPADGAEVVEDPKTKPVGAVPWLEVPALEMALVRVLLPSPKLPVLAAAGVAAVVLRLGFGVLIPREKPVPPEAGVVPKLNPGVCVVGVCVVSEKRPVEGAVAAGWLGVPKLNPPVPEVEKEKPVAAVVVAVFAVPNVKPPAGAPVPPKLNPLMAVESPGGSYSDSGANPSASATLGRFRASSLLPPIVQPRPPPPPSPLLSAAMESATLVLVPVFTQLNSLPSCRPAAGVASIAIGALRLRLSHVTPGDPGAGAGQGPAPS